MKMEVDEATQRTIDGFEEAKKQREEDARRFCLDLANVPGVNDKTQSVLTRANMYYKFIKEGTAS